MSQDTANGVRALPAHVLMRGSLLAGSFHEVQLVGSGFRHENSPSPTRRVRIWELASFCAFA